MRKRILYLASVLILLIVAYMGINSYKVFLLNQQKSNTATMLVHSFIAKEIKQIDIKLNMDSFTLYLGDKDEWEIKGYESLPYQTSMINSYIEIICNVSADRIISQASTNLSNYGLDGKAVTVTYNFINGSKYTFIVGNQTPDKKAYYAKKAGSNTIYMINEGRGDTFQQSYKDLFVKEFLKEIDISNTEDINSIKFAGKDRKEEVLLTRLPKSEIVANISGYRMEKPEQYDVSLQVVDKITNELTGIMRGTVDKIYLSKELIAKCGLEPALYEVSVTTTSEVSTLMVGGYNTDGLRYVMRKGVDILFLVDNEKLKWVFTTPDEFISPNPFIRELSSINKITVEDTTNKFNIDINKANNFASINGIEVPESDFNKFFSKIMTISSAGILNESEIKKFQSKRADLTFKFTYNNGMKGDTLEFVRMDDWLYLLKINGYGKLTVTKQNVEELQKYYFKLV